ncbi:MAG TPA: hypothetical protein VJ997_09640 [Longimicrobiales bacterium]|nr:hypothetical protein [Longimicrobiales bacterium]
MATIGPSKVQSARVVSSGPVYVDISDKPIRTNIVREGFQVPAATVDEAQITSVLERLPPIGRVEASRVVVQSIPAGTRVTAGTVVNVVLAPKSSVPTGIFVGAHADLRGTVISQVTEAFANTNVLRTLLSYDNPAAAPEAERAAVQAEAESRFGIAVDPQDSTRDMSALWTTLRNAAAYR